MNVRRWKFDHINKRSNEKVSNQGATVEKEGIYETDVDKRLNQAKHS